MKKKPAYTSKHVKARRADAGDSRVGQRVRTRRLEQCLSQTELAKQIGVTFQQVQKYEKGVNRIGASRLEKIAVALDVAPSYFFEDTAEGDASGIIAMAQDRGAVRLLTAYRNINKDKRPALVELAEQMVA